MANKRVTIILPEELDADVEVFAALVGQQKADVIASALSAYLVAKGYDDISGAIKKFRKRLEVSRDPSP